MVSGSLFKFVFKGFCDFRVLQLLLLVSHFRILKFILEELDSAFENLVFSALFALSFCEGSFEVKDLILKRFSLMFEWIILNAPHKAPFGET